LPLAFPEPGRDRRLDRHKAETHTLRVNLRGTILSLIAIGLVLLFAGTVVLQGWPRETKDRFPPEAMARMVEGPMSAVRERGLAQGDAAFERLVSGEKARDGSNRVRIADLHMAYGVELYMEWSAKNDIALLEASRDRIRASIPLYRAAFGPAHPEVALALNSFADVEIDLNGDESPAGKAALREALRIRRATLGAENAETLATEARLESLNPRRLGARGSADPNSAGSIADSIR
jgi:hypothetical protein